MSDFNPTERVSYSSITTHRTCPQKWGYRYLSDLEPVNDGSPYTVLGTWWHALRAAEAIRRGVTFGSLKSAPAEIQCADNLTLVQRCSVKAGTRADYAADIDEYVLPKIGKVVTVNAALIHRLSEVWWRQRPEDFKEEFVEALGGPLPDRLAYLNDGWVARQSGNLQPIAVEFKFTVPLNHDAPLELRLRGELRGYVDEVYYDPDKALTVIADHKTSKTLDAADSALDMSDSQLHLYARGVEIALALKVDAISYDRVRSTAPKSPALTAAGLLSKSVTDYDLRTYRSWVGDGIPWGTEGDFVKTGKNAGKPKFGVYEVDPKVVERLSQPDEQSKWFQTTLVPVNRHVANAHWQAAADTHLAMVATRQRWLDSGQAAHNFTRNNCKFCEYASLCRAQMLGGPDGEYDPAEHGLTQRKEHA